MPKRASWSAKKTVFAQTVKRAPVTGGLVKDHHPYGMNFCLALQQSPDCPS